MQWIVNLEKGVHEQNTVRLDGAGIQQNWLGGAGEAIAVEKIEVTNIAVKQPTCRGSAEP